MRDLSGAHVSLSPCRRESILTQQVIPRRGTDYGILPFFQMIKYSFAISSVTLSMFKTGKLQGVLLKKH